MAKDTVQASTLSPIHHQLPSCSDQQPLQKLIPSHLEASKIQSRHKTHHFSKFPIV